ncbi:hypothetical protein K491DRAFT_62984 [Lophiostoma macrostomum CBS 122681]|uniref:Uncharacterized protein n=1 Tax=Lophiostoma macrostomum CBS 122681 TaxID=1314788 RepID=A0A6A6TMM4_9PLEO|nr:hypothetical protein K491DRAFT_62984 [Lophiostoma macrostomum CBS 122681]
MCSADYNSTEYLLHSPENPVFLVFTFFSAALHGVPVVFLGLGGFLGPFRKHYPNTLREYMKFAVSLPFPSTWIWMGPCGSRLLEWRMEGHCSQAVTACRESSHWRPL